MAALRKVTLSDAGDGQVVRIPRDMRLPGTEATIRRVGGQIVLEAVAPAPATNRTLADYLATLEPIDDDFGPIEDLPPDPVDL